MTICCNLQNNTHRLISLFIIFTISTILISCENDTQASSLPECLVGTYLNEEGSGTKSIWNLSSDGIFTGQSSTEKLLNFSGQMGTWTATGNREAKILMLDFSFDEDGEVANTARIDIQVEFSGEKCENINGSFEIRFFEDGEDPLNIYTDDGEPIDDTFTGRKVIL